MEAIWACACDGILAEEAALRLVRVGKYVCEQSDRKGHSPSTFKCPSVGVGETSFLKNIKPA